MKSPRMIKSSNRQYLIGILIVIGVASLCYPVTDLVGYRSVSLILLVSVSLLAMRMSIGPVIVSTILSVVIWDFFFIPPYFTFTVNNTEDALMLLMYFIIALLNGVLTYKIRNYEKIARRREDKGATLQLYNILFNAISHEFRSPVATIWAASDNLLDSEQAGSTKDRQRMVKEIHDSAECLNRLIDKLLNMSRLESGHIVLHWKWCDIGELLQAVVKRLETDLNSRRILISLPEDLPLVRLDFALMEQVFFNILHNAAIHTPEGTTIEIQADYVDGHLVMKITDDGPGFPEEDMQWIFEKFFRAKGAKSGGTGLGLNIVRGLVEAHHGSIEVGKRPEGGAIFILKIPTGFLKKGAMEH